MLFQIAVSGGQYELPGSGGPEAGPLTDYTSIAYVFASLGSVIIC